MNASFHSWLRYCLPASPSEIMADLQICHRTLKDEYAGFPKDAPALSAALIGLEEDGLLERRNGCWFWLAEAVKAEPQRELFA